MTLKGFSVHVIVWLSLLGGKKKVNLFIFQSLYSPLLAGKFSTLAGSIHLCFF